MAENDRQKRGRKLLLTLLIVGVIGSIAGIGTFSAFSDTTSNDNNSFAAGTVYITDDDAGAALYSVTNQAPLDSVTNCINVTYLGTLDADVHFYASLSGGALEPYVDVLVEEGTGATAFGDCTGFTPAGTVYTGTLAGMPTSWASGPATGGTWAQNDTHSYRFTVTLQDDPAANGGSGGSLSTGLHSFIWEAQNQ